MQKLQNPDWEVNSRILNKHFPGVYPCASCSANGTCSNNLKCTRWLQFVHTAWDDIIRLLKGDSDESLQ